MTTNQRELARIIIKINQDPRLPPLSPPTEASLIERGALTPDWRTHDHPELFAPAPPRPPLGHSGWGEAAMDCDPDPTPHRRQARA